MEMKDNLKFNIHASVVFKLGEDLVTDDMQALVELIKNSYDADASFCKVVINTQDKLTEKTFFPDSRGFIIVEDDGIGMGSKKIEDGWLTISNSEKRNMKERGEQTNLGRSPLGDKGLGRLASQRLGDNIEIKTSPEKINKFYHVGFSWKDFIGDSLLKDIPIKKTESPSDRKRGTKIIISNLISPETWRGRESLDKIRSKLAALISPYKEVKNFKAYVQVDGKTLDLAEISDKIREVAPLRYKLEFNKNTGFTIEGKVAISFLRPYQDKNKLKLFKKYIEKDKGKEFLKFLLKKDKSEKIKDPESSKWLIKYVSIKAWKDFDKIQSKNGEPYYPGPFHGEVDSFLFRGVDQNIFDKHSEYSKFIKILSGIRVYRDGFGIRIPHDWLGLSRQQTTGGSWYGLRPQNTAGYIVITAKDNSCLEETTNREGFKENPYYNNFYDILQHFVKESHNFQEQVRRTLNDFLNNKIKGESKGEDSADIGEIVNNIRKQFEEATNNKENLEKTIESLGDMNVSISEIKSNIEVSLKTSPENKQVFITALQKIEELNKEINESLNKLQEKLNEQEKLQKQTESLKKAIEDLGEEVILLFEAASLGITVESFTHELDNMLDRLNDKTRTIGLYIKDKSIKDARIITYIEDIRSFISSTRKQLSHLAPSLRYVREDKEEIDIEEFLNKEKQFHDEYFNQNKIFIEIKNKSKSRFKIKINKGKLAQIIGNIFNNAEYWLKENMRMKILEKGIINIELDSPYVRIWDNGKGIDTSVENTLFEPFITTKKTGRGLGLFIIRQLLDLEGCSIELCDERNENKRKYIFQIDLGGVFNE